MLRIEIQNKNKEISILSETSSLRQRRGGVHNETRNSKSENEQGKKEMIEVVLEPRPLPFPGLRPVCEVENRVGLRAQH